MTHPVLFILVSFAQKKGKSPALTTHCKMLEMRIAGENTKNNSLGPVWLFLTPAGLGNVCWILSHQIQYHSPPPPPFSRSLGPLKRGGGRKVGTEERGEMPQATRPDFQFTLEEKGGEMFKNLPWLTEHLLQVRHPARYSRGNRSSQRQCSTNNNEKNKNVSSHMSRIYYAPGSLLGIFYSSL